MRHFKVRKDWEVTDMLADLSIEENVYKDMSADSLHRMITAFLWTVLKIDVDVAESIVDHEIMIDREDSYFCIDNVRYNFHIKSRFSWFEAGLYEMTPVFSLFEEEENLPF